MRQTIRLTESELRDIINETINEALEDEGFWDGIGAVRNKVSNYMGRKGADLKAQGKEFYNNKKEQAKNFINTKKEQAKDYYNTKKEQVGQKVQTMKNTYNAGSIAGDAKKNLENACTAIYNLLQNNQALADKGLQTVFNARQINWLKTVYKSLSNKYTQSFNSMRDSYVNPSGQR